jgi:hypothetical protein
MSHAHACSPLTRGHPAASIFLPPAVARTFRDMTSAHPYPLLARTVLAYPAIDNHAHPLLAESHRDAFPFEQLVSEAAGASNAANIPHLLAFYNATARLSELYTIAPFQAAGDVEMAAANPPETIPEVLPGTGAHSSWAALKAYRTGRSYEEMCQQTMRACHIETILFDDGLDGVKELCASRDWHNQFVRNPCKRIVRIETVAQVGANYMLVRHFVHSYKYRIYSSRCSQTCIARTE